MCFSAMKLMKFATVVMKTKPVIAVHSISAMKHSTTMKTIDNALQEALRMIDFRFVSAFETRLNIEDARVCNVETLKMSSMRTKMEMETEAQMKMRNQVSSISSFCFSI
jgi:hypothetical protein